MLAGAQITRFAPSPTGELHLGNARTALFNFLLARQSGGRFLLRIEDTDRERSKQEFVNALKRDLEWLGLGWDGAPLRQSERGAEYQSAFAELGKLGRVYPCYCSAQQLQFSRRAQLASGRAPRYAGTCRELTIEQRAAQERAGRMAGWRFRVNAGEKIEFDDLVHGAQAFASDDIGDFVIQRADGTAAFFFANAVDDAAMGITLVLRGEDHLANTPRQLMLLTALGRPAPRYAHVALINGMDGTPLSKRNGARSVAQLRAEGYLAEAINNLLFRLGHASAEGELLSLAAMTQKLDARHFGRAPARFDVAQLQSWQKQAAHALPAERFADWLGTIRPSHRDAQQLQHWYRAVQANTVLPADAATWARVIDGPAPALEASALEKVQVAGAGFFAAAAAAAREHGPNWQAICKAAQAASGAKGASLYRPLRLALTGNEQGPDLGTFLLAMSADEIHRRLQRFAT